MTNERQLCLISSVRATMLTGLLISMHIHAHAASSEVAISYFEHCEHIWSGVLSVSYNRKGPGYEDEGEIEAAFDYSQKGIYFRHQMPQANFTIIRNADDSFRFDHGNEIVNKGVRDKTWPDVYRNPFDWRCIGVANFGEWDRRTTLEEVLKFLQGAAGKPTIGDQGDGVKLLTWKHDVLGSKGNTIAQTIREVEVDVEKGYVPVRQKQRMVRKSASVGSVETLEYEASIEWAQTADEWVPVKWNYIGSGGVVEGEYRFTWEKVNVPLDASLFAIEALKAPKGSYVVDDRLGEPVIESVIGNDMANVYNDSDLLDSGDMNKSIFQRSLLYINIAVVIALMFAVAVRFMRRSKSFD